MCWKQPGAAFAGLAKSKNPMLLPTPHLSPSSPRHVLRHSRPGSEHAGVGDSPVAFQNRSQWGVFVDWQTPSKQTPTKTARAQGRQGSSARVNGRGREWGWRKGPACRLGLACLLSARWATKRCRRRQAGRLLRCAGSQRARACLLAPWLPGELTSDSHGMPSGCGCGVTSNVCQLVTWMVQASSVAKQVPAEHTPARPHSVSQGSPFSCGSPV